MTPHLQCFIVLCAALVAWFVVEAVDCAVIEARGGDWEEYDER